MSVHRRYYATQYGYTVAYYAILQERLKLFLGHRPDVARNRNGDGMKPRGEWHEEEAKKRWVYSHPDAEFYCEIQQWHPGEFRIEVDAGLARAVDLIFGNLAEAQLHGWNLGVALINTRASTLKGEKL